MAEQKIAIIGSGISGLTCAHALSGSHDITVYEAEDYIGGHTHTVEVEKEGEVSHIDTGFIVFNDRTYPNFIELMERIGVSYQPTEMSFSVRNDQLNMEYNGNTINSLFAQRSNLLRPRFLAMVYEIVRFNNDVKNVVTRDKEITLGQYLDEQKYTATFKDNYLLPMVSAIWSMGLDRCMDFPLAFFVRFFDNHGLLNIVHRPQWYTISGGSSRYIEPLIKSFRERIKLRCQVKRVGRSQDHIIIHTEHESRAYDQVIFACHANQALKMLEQPTAEENKILREFRTSENSVVLHTDTSFLPRRKLAWASWNYNMVDSAGEKTTLTYNMNILQRLQKKFTYLVTLNQEIPEHHILRQFTYFHPVYTQGAINSQNRWADISGKNRSHFCGAYWFNGFHEDGVKSGLRVARKLGGQDEY